MVFLETYDAALKALNANIAKLGCGDAAHVLSRDATRKLAWPAAPAGLVFLDPPWRKHDDDDDLAALALSNLISIGAIENGGIISIEHDHRRRRHWPITSHCWKHAAGVNLPVASAAIPPSGGKTDFRFQQATGRSMSACRDYTDLNAV